MSNNSVVLGIKALGQTAFTEYENVLRFSFVKERYTPYGLLSASVLCNSDPGEIYEVKFTINGKLIHYGILDSSEMSFGSSGSVLTVKSRSFTSMLGQNELAPGILSKPCLNTLMSNYTAIPNVTWENNTTTVNYVYIKEHASQWEAIVILCLAVKASYPYIYGTNQIRFNRHENPVHVVPYRKIISYGTTSDLSRVISKIYMKDANNTYNSYSYTDGFGTQRGIVRNKYIAFDKQWLSKTPTFGLDFRLFYSERANKAKFCRYSGYNGEDINDYISFGNNTNLSISSVSVTGNAKGIVTTDTCYLDRYCNC